MCICFPVHIGGTGVNENNADSVLGEFRVGATAAALQNADDFTRMKEF